MSLDKETLSAISKTILNTADPKRAERNLVRFIELNPDRTLSPSQMDAAAKLFAASQFLANFCISRPDELFAAIKGRKKEITRKLFHNSAKKKISLEVDLNSDSLMRDLRLFKKRSLMRITLRDLTGESDIQNSMDELTLLAEAVVSRALEGSLTLNQQKFGGPEVCSIAIIALGKLGGEELNYSSDVDLIAVYDNDEGQTEGIPGPSGVMYNRISSHEFYCKTVELLNKLLSSHTEDGIAYRVDLRLRPQGQKGDIALPLKAYRTYYESWGRTWERMMLIRARPVAGDIKLGKAFMEAIKPFLWRDAMDFTEIEEIQGLKKKIDSTFSRDDIKRGYGGIREVEFFVQTFQLLFGGTHSSLRTYRILNAIQALKWMKKVPEDDLTTLWNNYLFLRRTEHYIQMKEDLQTHTLPSSDEDIESLARLMGYQSGDTFHQALRIARMQTKSMYNSLLGTREDADTEAMNLLEGGLKDNELTGYLTFRKVNDPVRFTASLKKIKEHMRVFHTMQERSLSRKVIPQFLESALRSENPDRTIAGVENLMTTYGIRTAHMTAFLEQKELIEGTVKVFSFSPYLTRIFFSNQQYLNLLIEEWSILKTLRDFEERLERATGKGGNFEANLAGFRRFEELRIGILFLSNILEAADLFRGLSQIAEAIINAVMEKYGCKGLSVIALGKLGGREMTFGSDLDIVFVSETAEAMTAAEKIIKALTAYTDAGHLYSVDTRLRPEGSKGLLVNGLDGYRKYYIGSARKWEIQALLKARPVSGDNELARSFLDMAREVIILRGPDIRAQDITDMRQRIIKELSHESDGIDIKLGPGGVGEIEFRVQFLQLRNAAAFPEILVQDTLKAINRLAKKNLLTGANRDTLYSTYKYYRKLHTFMRLNEVEVINSASEVTALAAGFMGHSTKEEFLNHLKGLREKVIASVSRT